MASSQETFSFLVTTDNHMGFRQDDRIRHKDAYMAFKEALQISREQNVDFVLLGGDLFHMNKPSAAVEHKCIKILRQHLNAQIDRRVTFRRIEGEFSHFERLKHANFEDRNLNVPIPILTIHGNHDDPTGPNAQSACVKLATSGLLNYFGFLKLSESEELVVKPIILQKGSIKIALYGIGFIPDEKLLTAFKRNKVKFVEPPKDTFNILIVHQNRIPFNKNKYIPDDMFPDYFHLLIRGHEHATLAPEKIPGSKVCGLVYQPGSTVATSISSMEYGPKRVSVMTVRRVDSGSGGGDLASRQYKLDYELLPLKCCRKMLLRDISQKEVIESSKKQKQLTPVEYKQRLKTYVVTTIKSMLSKVERASDTLLAAEHSQGDSASDSQDTQIYEKLYRFDLPLIRVRLEYVDKAERFDEEDVNMKFYPNLVANRNMILFKKQKLVQNERGQLESATFENDVDDDVDEPDEFDAIDLDQRDTIDTWIENYFQDLPEKDQLFVLSLAEYIDALRGAADDGNVIGKVLGKKRKEIMSRYKAALGDEDTAQVEFHDENKVSNWFVKAFKSIEAERLSEVSKKTDSERFSEYFQRVAA